MIIVINSMSTIVQSSKTDLRILPVKIRHIYFWIGGDSYLHIYTIDSLQKRRFNCLFGDSAGVWRLVVQKNDQAKLIGEKHLLAFHGEWTRPLDPLDSAGVWN